MQAKFLDEPEQALQIAGDYRQRALPTRKSAVIPGS